MSNCSEFIKRSARVNYILLCVFIALSITSHLIAYRLVSVFGVPLFPSSLTYMMCFVIIDMFATYNSVKFMWLVISLESIANFIMVLVTHYVIYSPHPVYLENYISFIDVFSPLSRLYWANIIGSFIAMSINSLLFIYLYKIKGISFIISSMLSSLFVIVLYTTVTDYFAFDYLYKDHIVDLIIVNVISNSLFILLLSIPSRIVVRNIIKYTNRGSW